MNDQLKYYLAYTIIYGIILLMGEGLYRYLHVNPARSRNFSHLAAGLISLPYPWLFSVHGWVLLLTVQSSLVLLLTRKIGFIPSHHKAAGKGLGSYLFFASLYICYLAALRTGLKEFFVLPILILTISDVTASYFGQKYGEKPFLFFGGLNPANKTSAGSLAFLITTYIIVIFAYTLYLERTLFRIILMSFMIALPATLVELFSRRGSDNFFIPITVLIILWLEYVI
jgi:dolichol kinase